MKRLYRAGKDKIVAGIAQGLGDYFQIDPVIFRIVLVALTLFGGSGVVIYVLLWLVIPGQNQIKYPAADLVENNAREIKEYARHTIRHSRLVWAIALLIIGAWFLLNNWGLFRFVFWEWFWPLTAIVIGLLIIIT